MHGRALRVHLTMTMAIICLGNVLLALSGFAFLLLGAALLAMCVSQSDLAWMLIALLVLGIGGAFCSLALMQAGCEQPRQDPNVEERRIAADCES